MPDTPRDSAAQQPLAREVRSEGYEPTLTTDGLSATDQPGAAATVYFVWHDDTLHGVYGSVDKANAARAVLDEKERTEFGQLALRTEVTAVAVQ